MSELTKALIGRTFSPMSGSRLGPAWGDLLRLPPIAPLRDAPPANSTHDVHRRRLFAHRTYHGRRRH